MVDGRYKVIYADPPWRYETWTELKTETMRRKCGSTCYPVMSSKQLCELPVKAISDERCVLFIWVTMPKLNEVFGVIDSWGFVYKTCAFTWVKQNPSGNGIYSGLGHWTLANPELCLLATHKKFPPRVHPVKQLVLAPRSNHSQKPSVVRDRIVELVGDLPRVELFATERVPGWDAMGDAIDGCDIRVSLAKKIAELEIG